jgi:DNA repair protein RadC
MQDLPKEMMPREEFERIGATNVAAETLLAIILRSGLPGQNVSALARAILQHFGGLEKLAKADYDELRTAKIKGLGRVKCLELAAALELGRRASAPAAQPEQPSFLREPQAVYRMMTPLTHSLKQELFWVIMLDVKNRMIGRPVEVSRGLLNTSLIHPREIFSKAIRCNAAAIILAHNHPSGDPTPSDEDLEITRRLVNAAHIIGISVLDHLILGQPSEDTPGYISLRERELVPFTINGANKTTPS